MSKRINGLKAKNSTKLIPLTTKITRPTIITTMLRIILREFSSPAKIFDHDLILADMVLTLDWII